MYYKSASYKAFYGVNAFLLGVVAIVCILPMIHILAISFSGAAPANNHLVSLWPMEFTVKAYEESIGNPLYLHSMWVSVKRVAIGTGIGMLITILAAYPLSKSDGLLKGRPFFVWFFVVTMLFSGGLVPNYVLIQKLGLMNSFWALILPNLVGVYNMILLLNFFRGIPKELEESAFIDGAGFLRTLFSVFVPLSLPAIATLSLFNIVWHWNAYFDGMIYLSHREDWPLSTLLQTIVVDIDPNSIKSMDTQQLAKLSDRTVKASQIFIGALPVMLIYPFLQKFFVKGVVLGAVKE